MFSALDIFIYNRNNKFINNFSYFNKINRGVDKVERIFFNYIKKFWFNIDENNNISNY